MKISELGEFELIDKITAGCICSPATVVQGIGDDAAVLLPSLRKLQLATADMLVENIHFTLATISPYQLGWKAVAVNLSDIAAMGGVPLHVLVSLGLPKNSSVAFVDELYAGMKEICHKFQVNIVGGDMVASPDAMVINVTALGEIEPARLVKRSGAQVGDLLLVTGTLGDSAGGLQALQSDQVFSEAKVTRLINAHLTPVPRVEAGQMLAALGATSMDDISDGLAEEIHAVTQASGVGARIYRKSIPLSSELLACADILSMRPEELAVFGGEDYELLFTLPPEKMLELQQANLPVSCAVIGEITEAEDGITIVNEEGYAEQLGRRGYNHFR